MARANGQSLRAIGMLGDGDAAAWIARFTGSSQDKAEKSISRR